MVEDKKRERRESGGYGEVEKECGKITTVMRFQHNRRSVRGAPEKVNTPASAMHKGVRGIRHESWVILKQLENPEQHSRNQSMKKERNSVSLISAV